MSDPRYVQAREIFLGACDLQGEERRHYLSETCGENIDLRQEVESLLHHHDTWRTTPSAGEVTKRERFRPGEIFAERYRIVALLGEGGMGQVYRAEDERLGVSVAVKVLSPEAHGRERLLAEVRQARQVTHPAVCRVHDAGEWEGELFITMEYVAGDDLESLLRRIGRMPSDKVLDVARQLCAGLAAAHARGVLHRDLKPANILIDPEGRVRIADFGIAVARETSDSEPLAGTPEYMAPELLLPPHVSSERSDLYSLGLVLYELAAGRLPYEVRDSESSPVSGRMRPPPPSRFAPDLDPELESAILACLSPDPGERPASVLALAARLPGTDALSLAEEARMTPSPDVVAASGGQPITSRGRLWGAFVAALVLLIVGLGLGGSASILERAGVVKPPQVLADRAREMVATLGYPGEPEAPRYGYLEDPQPTLPGGTASSEPSNVGRRSAIRFWYRQETDRALPESTRRLLYGRPSDPEPPVAGRIITILDQEARLLYFQADPVDETAEAIAANQLGEGQAEVDWSAAISMTGLVASDLTPAEPGIAPVFADARASWLGNDPAGSRIRLDLATTGNRIVYAAVTPTDGSTGEGSEALEARAERADLVGFFILAILLVALPLTFSNLRRRRGDRKGARRLVTLILAVLTASWLLRIGWISHPLDETVDLVAERLATLVIHGLWLWVGYLALEPSLRRSWPRVLVGWSRLLGGRLRDVMVGRDVLVGVLVGTGWVALNFLHYLIERRLDIGETPAPPGATWLESTLSARLLFATALATLPRAVYDGLVTLLILLLLRWLLRRKALATAGFILVYSLIVVFSGGGSTISWITLALPVASIAAFTLVRFGLLAYISARYVVYLIHAYPLTLDLRLWYSGGALFAGGMVVLLGAAALWAALGATEASESRHSPA